MDTTPTEDILELVDHLFRREGGKVVAALTRRFGMERLDLAEDILQEVLLKALAQWSDTNIPVDPAGWMLVAARNLAVDHIRRESFMMQHEDEIAAHFERLLENPAFIPLLDSEIEDDMLRMIFTCCHPVLTRESQIAFTLRTLASYSTRDIARVMMMEEVNVARRILRAKEKMREALVQFEVPIGEELDQRLNAVLNVLYLIFTLGYESSAAEPALQRESCEDALRLALLLRSHPAGSAPKVSALIALMYFQLARMNGSKRVDGSSIPLAEQDRSRWDQALIANGFEHLNRSMQGDVLSQYHLEAIIASCHCAASSFDQTDWQRIIVLYDLLMTMNPSQAVEIGKQNAERALARFGRETGGTGGAQLN